MKSLSGYISKISLTRLFLNCLLLVDTVKTRQMVPNFHEWNYMEYWKII